MPIPWPIKMKINPEATIQKIRHPGFVTQVETRGIP